MPNNAPSLVIDAKFPLESWQRLGEADGPEQMRFAANGFKNDMGVHIRAISEKYLIAGETADTAFLFVPSESICKRTSPRLPVTSETSSRRRARWRAEASASRRWSSMTYGRSSGWLASNPLTIAHESRSVIPKRGCAP
jgi:hypothetical protein